MLLLQSFCKIRDREKLSPRGEAITITIIIEETITITIIEEEEGEEEGEEAEAEAEGATVPENQVRKRNSIIQLTKYKTFRSMDENININSSFAIFVTLGGMQERREEPIPTQVKLAQQIVGRLGDYSSMTEDDDLVANIQALAGIFTTVGKQEK